MKKKKLTRRKIKYNTKKKRKSTRKRRSTKPIYKKIKKGGANSSNKERIDEIKKRIDEIKKRIDEIQKKIDLAHSEVEKANLEVENIKKNKKVSEPSEILDKQLDSAMAVLRKAIKKRAKLAAEKGMKEKEKRLAEKEAKELKPDPESESEESDKLDSESSEESKPESESKSEFDSDLKKKIGISTAAALLSLQSPQRDYYEYCGGKFSLIKYQENILTFIYNGKEYKLTLEQPIYKILLNMEDDYDNLIKNKCEELIKNLRINKNTNEYECSWLNNDTSFGKLELNYKTTSAPVSSPTPAPETESEPDAYKKGGFENYNNRPIGLDNLGNTCFFNTILQCIMNTENFAINLLNCKNEKDLIDKNKLKNDTGEDKKLKTDVVFSFYNLIQHFWDKSETETEIKTKKTKNLLTYLKKNLCNIENSSSENIENKNKFGEIFCRGEQHDTFETLRLIFYIFKETMKDEYFKNLFYFKQSEIIELVDPVYNDSKEFKDGKKEIHDHEEWHLKLPIVNFSNNEKPKYHTTLKECFYNKDLLPDYKNDKGDVIKANKYMNLITFPENLIIFLDIYYQKNIKGENEPIERTIYGHDVIFYEELDIDNVKNEKETYKLYGVIYKSGIIDGGHYITYIKRRDKKWYKISDETVDSEKPKTFSKNIEINNHQYNAYGLFYKKVKKV